MAPKKYRPQNFPSRSKEKMRLSAWTNQLPKKVVICGVSYRVIYNMNRGACFSGANCEIKVGCGSGSNP